MEELAIERKRHEEEQERLAALQDSLVDRRRFDRDEYDRWQRDAEIIPAWQCGGGRRIVRSSAPYDG